MQIVCKTYTSAVARMTIEQMNQRKLDSWLHGIDLDQMPLNCRAWVSALNTFCYLYWVYCVNLFVTCKCCNSTSKQCAVK